MYERGTQLLLKWSTQLNLLHVHKCTKKKACTFAVVFSFLSLLLKYNIVRWLICTSNKHLLRLNNLIKG